jgi:hypothetical protein
MKLWSMIRLQRADVMVALPSRHSCFISYCDADSRFVDRLHRDFLLASIKCWKWTGDARVGAALWNEIERAMRAHDKIVLVASRNSLNSDPVNREIEIALRIERELQRDVLTPVTLDDYLFAEWQGVNRPLLLSKMIADARGWEENPARYDDVRERLIGSLAIQIAK